MPPASAMAANNNLDPFGQFGQLALDPYNNPQPPPDSSNQAPAPGTPPTGPKGGDAMMTGGMNDGYQYSSQQPMQQRQQPMQVSPEHPVNPGFGQPQGQMQMQPQPQGAYANYQYNVYAQPPHLQPQMQQQPLQPNMQPYQPHGPTAGTPLKLTSPPISPLCTPASPDQSPPDGANRIQNFEPHAGAPVPTLSPGASPVANPFDLFGSPAQAPAGPAPAAPAGPFGAAPAPFGDPQQPTSQQPAPQQSQQDDADFWNNMGFSNAAPAGNDGAGGASLGNVTPAAASDASLSSGDDANPYLHGQPVDLSLDRAPVSLDDRGLPAGGEYYKARVTTPMLGAIFSSAKELRSTLYKTASDSFVEAIGERPVISFTIDGSAADTAGIGLGHVLMKVNDEEVRQTDQAVKTVGAAARPMIMEFYAPNKEVRVVKTEGQCMVKYDNHSTEAPASACEWKPKYVVVGDMLGKPHILYMYRSKAEYDIAVKESQTRNRALSVKVKQFDIRGAKIFHERGAVQYPNKPKWHYFTVVRGTGLPIKISARTPEELHPVYEGIVGFLDREARTKRLRIEQTRERMQMAGMYRETYY